MLNIGDGGSVALDGALTVDTVEVLARDCHRLMAANHDGRLEIDLTGVTRSDSAGLALLVGWIAAARANHIALTFRGVPQRLLAIAKISEVDGLLTGAVPA